VLGNNTGVNKTGRGGNRVFIGRGFRFLRHRGDSDGVAFIKQTETDAVNATAGEEKHFADGDGGAIYGGRAAALLHRPGTKSGEHHNTAVKHTDTFYLYLFFPDKPAERTFHPKSYFGDGGDGGGDVFTVPVKIINDVIPVKTGIQWGEKGVWIPAVVYPVHR